MHLENFCVPGQYLSTLTFMIKVILLIVCGYEFNVIVMLFCALSPQILSLINLASKLKLLAKRFRQIFIKKGRILGMSKTFFSMIVLNDGSLKLVKKTFPDSLNSLSNAPNLALTHSVSTVPNWALHPFNWKARRAIVGAQTFPTKKILSREKPFFVIQRSYWFN